MAIIKTGPVVTGIRGTIGGVTFSQNASSAYAKGWARSSNPKHPLQSLQRGTIGSMPQLWRDLTAIQQAAWDTFAALPAQQKTNPLGDTYFASGFNWFVTVNTWLTNIGRSTRVAPPVIARPAAPSLTSLELPFLPQQQAKVTYPAATFTPSLDIILEIVVAISTGRTVSPTNFKLLKQSQLPGDTETAFLIPYLERINLTGTTMKGFVRMYRQTADGQRSSAATASFISSDATPFSATALNYDAATNWAARGADLTGNADTKTITWSCFFRVNGGAGTDRYIHSSAAFRYIIFLDTSNSIWFLFRDSAAAIIYEFHSTTTFAADGAWHNVIMSLDTQTDRIQLVIDGALEAPVILNRVPDTTIDWTQANHFIATLNTLALFWDGCLSMLYFNTDAALDLADPNNIRLFIDDDGFPVDLGPNGEFPTEASPIIFLPAGDPSANAGTGGNFVNNAALAACASNPP